MCPDGLPTASVDVAAVSLLVDRLTAAVSGLFAEAGIDCMLVKGPVIAEWLYEEGLRPYGDTDLLVARADWDRATALLLGAGFRPDQFRVFLAAEQKRGVSVSGSPRACKVLSLRKCRPSADVRVLEPAAAGAFSEGV